MISDDIDTLEIPVSLDNESEPAIASENPATKDLVLATKHNKVLSRSLFRFSTMEFPFQRCGNKWKDEE